MKLTGNLKVEMVQEYKTSIFNIHTPKVQKKEWDQLKLQALHCCNPSFIDSIKYQDSTKS